MLRPVFIKESDGEVDVDWEHVPACDYNDVFFEALSRTRKSIQYVLEDYGLDNESIKNLLLVITSAQHMVCSAFKAKDDFSLDLHDFGDERDDLVLAIHKMLKDKNMPCWDDWDVLADLLNKSSDNN